MTYDEFYDARFMDDFMFVTYDPDTVIHDHKHTPERPPQRRQPVARRMKRCAICERR